MIRKSELSLRNISKAIGAVIAVFLLSAGTAGALSTYITAQGGTGTTSPSGILYGDNGATSHLNTVTVGTGLSFSGGTLSATGGGGTVGTSSAETAGQIPFWTSTNGTPATLSGGSANLTWNNSTNLFTVTGNASTTQLTVTGSTYLATTGGNVGIGTTSPSTTLAVAGGAYLNGTLGLKDATSIANPAIAFGSGLVFYRTGGINLGFGVNTGSTYLSFGANGINASSNLGIGWSSGNAGLIRDTTLSRLAAGVVGIGNGTQGDTSGTLIAASIGVATSSPYATLSIGGNVVVGAATAGGTLGDLYLPKLGTPSGSFLAVDASGKVIATTTPAGGAVSSVSNSDSTLTISPTTGAVVASLNLAHANTWTALQTFTNASSTAFSSGYASSTLGYFGTLTLPNLGTAAGSFLAVDATGKVIATTTPSGYSPIGTTGQFPYFSAANTLTATSTISAAATGNVGISSTTPPALLTVGYGYQPAVFTVASTSVWTGAGAYQYTAPAGTSFIQVSGKGSGGGGSAATSGGAGATIASTTMPLKAGDTGTIYVASGGTHTGSAGIGYKNGGLSGDGAEGAGASSAFIASSTGQAIIACGGSSAGNNQPGNNAAGGSGGDGKNASSAGGGGGGCGTPGNNGSGATGGAGGTGGTLASGSAANGGASNNNGGDGSITIVAFQSPTGATGGQLIAGLLTVNPASVSIGTSTASAMLTVQNFAGSDLLSLSGVLSSVNYVLETIDQFGHLITGGPTPAVSSCGTASIAGNDRNGRITTSGATSCTVTFANAWPSPPECTVSGTVASTQAVNTTATVLTITFGTSQTSSISYICQSYR